MQTVRTNLEQQFYKNIAQSFSVLLNWVGHHQSALRPIEATADRRVGFAARPACEKPRAKGPAFGRYVDGVRYLTKLNDGNHVRYGWWSQPVDATPGASRQ